MVNKVLNYCEQYHMIAPGDVIVTGVSGGADSVCLLFMLLAIREKISFHLAVAHVNHGLRKEAAMEAAYVRELCETRGIPFYLKEADMAGYAREASLSEEEAGRQIRYAFFREILILEGTKHQAEEEKWKIAVAHNRNDRAETMLFHLFRGTGLAGLCGIPAVNGRIIRPLLNLDRQEIEDYLEKEHIRYYTDSTNQEDHYARNRIRHHILPYAEDEICSGAVAHMNQTAENLRLAEDYLEKQTEEAAGRCVLPAGDMAAECTGKALSGSMEMAVSAEQKAAVMADQRMPDTAAGKQIRLDLDAFSQEDPYLRGRILHLFMERIAGQRKDITAAHLESMERLFLSEKNGELNLPYGITVYKNYRTGMLVKGKQERQEREAIAITGEGHFYADGLGEVEVTVFSCEKTGNIPEKRYTKWFDYDKITTSVLLRVRERGDYLTINSSMAHKSLQDYFVNEKIPRQERDSFYVLADGSHIMWVPGYRISEYYKVTEQTRNIMQVSIKRTEE